MPIANALNITTTGIQTFNATTGVFTASTVSQYGTVVGLANNLVTSVAPSATSGVPLISQGSSANPAFGTAVVAGGGTGSTSFNVNGVVISGTTTTSALTSLTLTNGQIVIGSTGNPPAAASLTAGTGISITPGANSITIANTALSGSLVLLSTQTASASSVITFTSLMSSTYKNYMLQCRNLICSAATAQLYLQLSTNNGSSYISTGYLGGASFGAYNAVFNGNANTTTGFYLVASATNAANRGAAGTFWLMNMNVGAYPYGYGQWNNPTGFVGLSSSVYTTAATVDAFQLLMSTGTITTGTFSLYGVVE